jgi:hypothetical protein
LHARVAAELRVHSSAIAGRSLDAQFAANPGLAERFGPKGVAASLRDAGHNIDHLAEAVALGDPDAFASYVVWLQGVLAAACVPAPVLVDHLRYLADAVREKLVADLAALAVQYIDHAVGRLGKQTK